MNINSQLLSDSLNFELRKQAVSKLVLIHPNFLYTHLRIYHHHHLL